MKNILLTILLFGSPICFTQNNVIDSLKTAISSSRETKKKVEMMLSLSQELEGYDLYKAIGNSKKAHQLAEKLDYKEGKAKASKAIGLEYYFLGKYSDALSHWEVAKAEFEETGDEAGVANMLSNIGAIYFNHSQYDKAIDLYLQALKIAEKVGDTLRMGTVLQNIGAVHNENNKHDAARKVYKRALTLFTAIKYDEGLGLVHLNLAEITDSKDAQEQLDHLEMALANLRSSMYYSEVMRLIGKTKSRTEGFESGYPYLDSAYQSALAAGDEFELTRIINTIAEVYEEAGKIQKAIEYFEKGKALLIDGDKANLELLLTTDGLIRLYAQTGNFKKAYENARLYIEIKNNVYAVETDDKIDKMLFGYELDKKKDSIELLVKDKALLVKDKKIQEIDAERQRNVRNALLLGIVIVLGFSGIAVYQRNRIKKGKKLSDDLLLNILPEEVAEELKMKGSADAQSIDLVTVLFTDFKGFTALSEILSPENLVAEINRCFSQFDLIMQKHGIEKIKTIGDAYMAAGGLPTPNDTHPCDVVNAALEIREFMMNLAKEKQALNEPFFEIRIGVHTGPVVAGIVGLKKFQYDIWGDTVNTASRMESSGEVGMVNISDSTYQFVKDRFAAEYRGEIQAKGKGELKMYFVDRLVKG